MPWFQTFGAIYQFNVAETYMLNVTSLKIILKIGLLIFFHIWLSPTNRIGYLKFPLKSLLQIEVRRRNLYTYVAVKLTVFDTAPVCISRTPSHLPCLYQRGHPWLSLPGVAGQARTKGLQSQHPLAHALFVISFWQQDITLNSYHIVISY